MKTGKCPFHASASAPPHDQPAAIGVEEEIADFLRDAASANLVGDGLADRLSAYRQEVAAGRPAPFTSAELSHAAQLAWRNSARCIGRLHWRALRVRDRRDVCSAAAIFGELCQHLAESTNGGSIRPTMTVFAPATTGRPAPRILNHQLAGYAGYRRGDFVLGDPKNVAFTESALGLGWRPPATRTAFDLLPWIIQGEDSRPQLFTPEPGLIREVPLSHPTLDWFHELGLRWYAVPVICDMVLRAAGTDFPAAPFGGWYMGTEIGARNLADVGRYNQLPAIARRMGLDTSDPATLWRDRALVELNTAVLHSFQAAGVRIVDHHTASAEFMRFNEQENRAGRTASAVWDWIVPPMSGAATPVFHLPMRDLHLRPNLLPRPGPI
jgi:nitric-oxide synthase